MLGLLGNTYWWGNISFYYIRAGNILSCSLLCLFFRFLYGVRVVWVAWCCLENGLHCRLTCPFFFSSFFSVAASFFFFFRCILDYFTTLLFYSFFATSVVVSVTSTFYLFFFIFTSTPGFSFHSYTFPADRNGACFRLMLFRCTGGFIPLNLCYFPVVVVAAVIKVCFLPASRQVLSFFFFLHLYTFSLIPINKCLRFPLL